MLVDTFIPTVGFNSTFSYLKNFEISLSPIEEGFKGSKFFFIKRPGFWTKKNQQGQYLREMDNNYVGHIVISDIGYFRDDDGKVYKFYKDATNNYVLEKIYDNPDGLEVYKKDKEGNYVNQRAIVINYLTEKLGSYTVQSANNFAGAGDIVELVVNEAGSFTPDDIGRFIYFPSSADAIRRWQIRQIIEVVDDRTVHLSEMLYGDPTTDPIANQPIEKYDRIDEVLVFNNLKHPTSRDVLTLELTTGNFNLRHLGGKDIAIFDGRLWIVPEDGSSVGGSLLTGEYEILDFTSVLGNIKTKAGEKILAIQPYKNYLLVFYKTMVAVVWQIGKDADNNPIYNWNTILGETGIFSPESYVIKEGNLYVFTIGKKFCGLEIKPQSTNIIEGTLTSQADIIQHKLNEVKDTQRVKLFDYDVGVGLLTSDEYGTKIWKYTFEYKGWYYHESKKEWKGYYKNIYGDMVNGIDRFVVLRGGDSDLGEPIEQEVQVVGPQQTYGDAFTILQIKLLLGFYENVMDFELFLDLGTEKYIGKIYDNSNGISFITWQNMATGSGALDTAPLSYILYGGYNTLKDHVNKIGLMGLRVGKSGVYYKLTIKNKDNKNINFGYIGVQYKQGNPLVVPIMNVT